MTAASPQQASARAAPRTRRAATESGQGRSPHPRLLGEWPLDEQAPLSPPRWLDRVDLVASLGRSQGLGYRAAFKSDGSVADDD